MVLAASRTIDSERYRHLIESTPEALMLGDGAGRVLDANERALDLFRCTVDEMRADPPWALCDASDPRFHEAIRTRAAVGRSDFQYRMVRRDGSVFEARIWSVLFHEGGQQRSWIGVTPVGETEAARNDLLRANAMLSAVIAGAPDGIIVVDDEGDIVHVNEVFLKTWGLDPTVALLPANERRAAAAVLLKDRAQFERELAALEADRDVALHEFIELVDGRVLEMHTHPIAQPGGERIGRIWYYSDVTEALSVRRQKEHVDAVLDAHFSLSTDGLLVVDDDGVLLRASRAFQELEIDGKRWVDLPFEEREEALRSRVKDKDRSRRFVDRWVNNPDERIEEVFELLDGGFREVRSMPLHTASGERLGRQFIYRDVTASENARLALEAANMLLAAQFEHSPHATLVIDNEERVIRVSESFFEATGLDGSQQSNFAAYKSYITGRITDLVASIKQTVDAAEVATGRPMELTASVWRDPDVAKNDYMQDYRTWLEQDLLEAPLFRAENPENRAPWESFDVYAVTGYFNAELHESSRQDMVRGWLAESRAAAEAAGQARGLTGAAL
ncbi:MAG TPA: PAS domain S-box protein, partial [Tepidiformaceae bacterium]|nr:PAS domain S-box protein [Tepidiformaceae bacterium]